MNFNDNSILQNNFNITDDELINFKNEGYIIFESVIEINARNTLKHAIDKASKENIEDAVYNNDLSKIIISKQLNHVVRKIMNGSEYHFHHLHAACHKSGMPSLGWHHDYEQYKERGREFTMIHIFLYLNGLNGEIGDLLLIPGSHNQNLKRYEYSSKDFDYFKNYKRINNIAEGSIIIINSALIHARQAKSGGDLKPRYFIDLSFCQSGIKWPPYRESKNWKNILPILKEKYANNNLSEFIFDHSAFELSLRDKIIEKFKLNNFKNLIAKFIGKNGKIIN